MSEFLYETHLHTREASACASCLGADYIKIYRDMGYSGIIVTDHFFNGNTCISEDLSWEERVEQFCSGYEHAKEEGDQQGLQVFFGWESCYDCDEYLIYGLDKDWLLRHESILSWSQREQFEYIRADGGLVVQVHPFRERGYIDKIRLHPQHADAIEVCNAGNAEGEDVLAYRFCERNHIPMTSGSDIHHSPNKEKVFLAGMAFPHKLLTIQDYINGVKSRTGRLLGVEELVFSVAEKRPSFPIELYDYEGEYREISYRDLF